MIRLIVLLIILLYCCIAYAKDITFSWTEYPTGTASWFNLYVDDSTTPHTTNIDITSTEITVTLADGTHKVWLTAYDNDNLEESRRSHGISVVVSGTEDTSTWIGSKTFKEGVHITGGTIK